MHGKKTKMKERVTEIRPGLLFKERKEGLVPSQMDSGLFKMPL